MHLRRAVLLAVLAGCGPGRDAAPPAQAVPAAPPGPGSAPLWCLVETGVESMHGHRALHARPAPGVDLEHGAVAAGPDEYHEAFADCGPQDGAVKVQGARLADGTWLVLLSCGRADWWESTRVLLQLRVAEARCEVLAAGLHWRADVWPLSAWAALERGALRVDDAELATRGCVRLAFDLHGEILEPFGAPGAEPWLQHVNGRVTLTLRDGALAALDASWAEQLERAATTR